MKTNLTLFAVRSAVSSAMRKMMLALVAAVMFLGSVAPSVRAQAPWSSRHSASAADRQLSEAVYRELMDLPFFTVFDNLQYRVNGTEVTLYGQTANTRLVSDARKFVEQIPNVTRVNDQIELLPQSRFDDRIRHDEFRAIYSHPVLQKYGEGTYPSIHIIVKNGHVTLVGEVNNQLDKQVAGTRAAQVRYVFSVENQLNVRTTQ